MADISRRGLLAGMAGLAAWAVAGCTNEPAFTPQPVVPPVSPITTPTPTPFVDSTPRWPLTGVPFSKDGEEKKAAHPAVAVKVPCEKRSFPQSGVADADLVFVEAQGDSYDGTRLCAVFHSKFPAEGANPVRSARPVDLALLAPLKAVLASTGATAWVVKYLLDNKKYVELRQKYGDRTDRWQLVSRRGGWWKGTAQTDKSVVAMPAALCRDATIAKNKVPPVYLQYALPGSQPSTVSGQPVKQLTVTFKYSLSGKPTAEYHRWDWDASSKKWVASIQFNEGPQWYKWTTREGKRVAADNVLVIFCAWKMGRVKGYSGHNEPMYSMIDGADKFAYFHDGTMVTGTWKKGAISDPFEFTLDDGTRLAMAPGKTWILLPNHNAPLKTKS